MSAQVAGTAVNHNQNSHAIGDPTVSKYSDYLGANSGFKDTGDSAESTTSENKSTLVEQTKNITDGPSTDVADSQRSLKQLDPNTNHPVASRSSSISDAKEIKRTEPEGSGRPGTSSRSASTAAVGEKERNGSIASSRKSGREKKMNSESTGQTSKPQAFTQPGTTTTATAAPMQTKKKSGFSRLFASIACCGTPSNANLVEEGQDAPRKIVKPQTSQPRQPTPASKAEPVQVNSSTDQSGDTTEKIGGPPYSEIKPAQQPQMQEIVKTNPSNGQAESPDNCDTSQLQGVTTGHPGTAGSTNQDSVSRAPAATTANEISAIPTSNTSIQQLPIPLLTQDSVTEAIPTQQVQSQDNDIEMTDASTANDPADHQDTETNEASETQQNVPAIPAAQANQTNAPTEPSRDPTASVNPISDKRTWLLPPMRPEFTGKKCLVLDLDETLVHASFKILHQADFTIPVEIEGQYHNVYVIKRPGVDQFMKRVGELYEVVVFTASVSKYGSPLLDQLDIHKVVHHRLFRESCYNHQGNYVKDLSQVGRDLKETIIIDNSPTSYIFHPQHAVPISSWFSDAHDNELLDLIPVLEDLAGSQVRDVSLVLDVSL
ncbi:hypothetical protein MMC25_003425 [Agyrium rufum]|nr:hypothetical protein [Agyrium rufum]